MHTYIHFAPSKGTISTTKVLDVTEGYFRGRAILYPPRIRPPPEFSVRRDKARRRKWIHVLSLDVYPDNVHGSYDGPYGGGRVPCASGTISIGPGWGGLGASQKRFVDFPPSKTTTICPQTFGFPSHATPQIPFVPIFPSPALPCPLAFRDPRPSPQGSPRLRAGRLNTAGNGNTGSPLVLPDLSDIVRRPLQPAVCTGNGNTYFTGASCRVRRRVYQIKHSARKRPPLGTRSFPPSDKPPV